MNNELDNPQTTLEAKLKEQAIELVTLKQQLEKLEQVLTEKAREIRESHHDIIESEKMSAIAQLASGVGHELRNPLGVIKASAYFLKMMLGENIDERVGKHIRLLESSVSESDRIISELLEFARPSQAIIVEININQSIKEVLDLIRLPEHIQTSYDFCDNPPSFGADANQMKQVFSNVINNAIQSMPDEGKLSVKTKAASDFMEVTISDTGIGIDEADLPKIFEPLFTTKAKGIGLGLAVVKRIIDNQGGTINVISEPDKGSTFTLTFPLPHPRH